MFQHTIYDTSQAIIEESEPSSGGNGGGGKICLKLVMYRQQIGETQHSYKDCLAAQPVGECLDPCRRSGLVGVQMPHFDWL